MVLMLGVVVCSPASSAALTTAAAVDESTKDQLARTARVILAQRSAALVERSRPQPLPGEIYGVRISPGLATAQQRAVRELETRNRAPVEGGPAFTEARTRLKSVQAVRSGNRIVLDATEYTEVEYESAGAERPPVIVQAVRRRFEFEAEGERLTLLGESPVSGDRPVDAESPSRP